MPLRDLLALHEGFRGEPYKDSLGYWTIGFGHLIDARKGGSLAGVAIPLTRPQALVLLDADIAEHALELARALPWVLKLDDVRQAVLIDMAFNLGVPGLLAFKLTLAAVQAGNYDEAQKQMLQSAWARQVGNRAVQLADMMKSGHWPQGT